MEKNKLNKNNNLAKSGLLREKLADNEHKRWSKWMEYVFNKSKFLDNGDVVIPSDLVCRWRRQIDTPYIHLSEQEKDSDRKEVDSILKILKDHLNL